MEVKKEILDQLMEECIQLAQLAKTQGESPVGAVVATPKGEVLGAAPEAVKAKSDLSCHAEIEAIRQCLGHHPDVDLSACCLVSTHEPCVMCSYYLRHYKIPLIVFALSVGPIGGFGSELAVLKTHSVPAWKETPMVISGYQAEKCSKAIS